MNLKEMNIEELKALLYNVKAELKTRESHELVLYTHDCKDRANHHINKYKHWAKLVECIDTTKTNGYAFDGSFLNVQSEHKIPSGSIVVEVCGYDLTAYRCTANGKEKIAKCKTNEMSSTIELLSTLV